MGAQGGFLVRTLVDAAGSYSVAHGAGLLPTELTGMWGWILLRSPRQGNELNVCNRSRTIGLLKLEVCARLESLPSHTCACVHTHTRTHARASLHQATRGCPGWLPVKLADIPLS